MLGMEKRGCLYVGGDDSNHAGDSKGEIDVATFSLDPTDSIVQYLSYRSKEKLDAWLKLQNRDYRFAVLTAERYKHIGQNLGNTMPDLIEAYIRQKRLWTPYIKIYLDGDLEERTKEEMKEKLLSFWRGNPENLTIETFAKRGKKGKGGRGRKHHCPAVVYYADSLAHRLYEEKTFEELSIHEKLIVIKDK